LRIAQPHARGLEEAIWAQVGGFLARSGLAVRELRQQLAEVRRRVLTQYGAGNFSDDEVRQEVESLGAEWAILDWEQEEKRSAKGPHRFCSVAAGSGREGCSGSCAASYWRAS
jgi:hypothetical protein